MIAFSMFVLLEISNNLSTPDFLFNIVDIFYHHHILLSIFLHKACFLTPASHPAPASLAVEQH
jgi:hypothetical protein